MKKGMQRGEAPLPVLTTSGVGAPWVEWRKMTGGADDEGRGCTVRGVSPECTGERKGDNGT